MAYIHVVMSLKDFAKYTEDTLEKHGGIFFIEEIGKGGVYSIRKIPGIDIEDNRARNLGFFIVSQEIAGISQTHIYKDETALFVIEGEGGRISEDSIERISLRVLSKNPDKKTTKIFNAIRNKLKKDDEIGMGVEGGSQIHNHYFYQKKYAGRKVFKNDFYNEKAGIVKLKSE
ncbi:hypothetical protein [Chryseobacterium sp.]|uniref:hypothetical protein n=1 Tax=Chryseobacterium sp. TaxID=1871047 RepID=UPI00321C1A41